MYCCQRKYMVREGNRTVQRRIMSPKFPLQTLTGYQEICLLLYIFDHLFGLKRMGKGEKEPVLFGTHVSSNPELGNIICHGTLLFPSLNIYLWLLYSFTSDDKNTDKMKFVLFRNLNETSLTRISGKGAPVWTLKSKLVLCSIYFKNLNTWALEGLSGNVSIRSVCFHFSSLYICEEPKTILKVKATCRFHNNYLCFISDVPFLSLVIEGTLPGNGFYCVILERRYVAFLCM